MKPIQSISFRANIPDDDGRVRTPKSEFKLGVGPCGKTVTSLKSEVMDGCLVIHQACDDGEKKGFIYPLAQIAGRIEVVTACQSDNDPF